MTMQTIMYKNMQLTNILPINKFLRIIPPKDTDFARIK